MKPDTLLNTLLSDYFGLTNAADVLYIVCDMEKELLIKKSGKNHQGELWQNAYFADTFIFMHFTDGSTVIYEDCIPSLIACAELHGWTVRKKLD